MKKLKSVAALLLAAAMTTSLAGCGGGNNGGSTGGNEAGGNDTPAATDAPAAGGNDAAPAAGGNDAAPAAGGDSAPAASGDIKDFTIFCAVPGQELTSDNRIKEVIAQKIGARCKETWLVGQSAEEAIGTMIAGGEYTDFLVGSSGSTTLIDNEAIIPLEDYIFSGKYPNVQNFYDEYEWAQIRNPDGHIYVIPQFGNNWERDTSPIHNDEAWWIQTRVLKWAGYPKIETMDEYFDVIERYLEANPTMEDGTPNIGYEILTEDWRYFCIENAPQFLDGYPNDGSCIVDRDTHQVIDYNTTPTAKRYFAKLNEEYKKGVIDPEFATLTYDEYIAKLSTGRVCGMIDQHWDFNTAELAIQNAGLDDCTYVPLGLVIEKGIRERYHSDAALDATGGVSISVSCKDVDGAMKFLDDLLSPEILTLRNWGQEGIDYLVDDNGLFYRNDEMRKNAVNQDYINANFCGYGYFPNYGGMDHDGKNAASPSNQPGEFYDSLPDGVKECLDGYGFKTYTDFLNQSDVLTDWYPMWSYSNGFTTGTPYGDAWVEMGRLKHVQLPQVVAADDFESAWSNYMDEYGKINVQAFIDEMQAEVQRRIDLAAQYK